MHARPPPPCHINSPGRFATSLTHTDSPEASDRVGVRRGRGGVEDGAGGERGGCRVKGGRVKRGRGFRQVGGWERSELYSHSLNPLWNRSMKWHSPVQRRRGRRRGRVEREVMREDLAAAKCRPESSRWRARGEAWLYSITPVSMRI